MPELRVLLIDSRLINNGQTAVRVPNVHVVDWDFRVADSQDGTRYRALTYRNDVWYGSTYWTGPNWTRVGKDWHHPGINTPAVRCFRAPAAGQVTITGRVYKADTNKGGGDGVRLSIKHNEKTVWQAEIAGNDSKGVEPKIALKVAKGDAVRFVVHKRGRIFHDTTRWDPIISYDGQMTLEYLCYELGEPRYDQQECRDLRLTYGMPFRIRRRYATGMLRIDVYE